MTKFTSKEVAAMLGITMNALHKRVAKRSMKPETVGRKAYYTVEDVEVLGERKPGSGSKTKLRARQACVERSAKRSPAKGVQRRRRATSSTKLYRVVVRNEAGVLFVTEVGLSKTLALKALKYYERLGKCAVAAPQGDKYPSIAMIRNKNEIDRTAAMKKEMLSIKNI